MCNNLSSAALQSDLLIYVKTFQIDPLISILSKSVNAVTMGGGGGYISCMLLNTIDNC